ncbi:colicin E3-like toxin immunity protein [Arsenophonus apicola]|uniref:colicin E3-like toxin immunity protein n=1 Tax=Arsenophonus apicola TaxID=2879119 RepID=UPI001CDD3E7F|nr:colicin E3-like toxin immunity protein [Arsenophonus apicola]UBX30952.1 cloacin immunity family protein [Arsenophonus apicola]
MGLKLQLSWFDKSTEVCIGEEYSIDLGENGTVIELLGLPIKGTINNGAFDIAMNWIKILQPYFNHKIKYDYYDYFVSFVYREDWPDNNKQT